jgi:RND family efflux transporter MFP subunit
MDAFTHEIKVQGNVETDQDILLNAEMGGLITSINVKEGQKVSKGTLIATIDASIMASNMVELQTQLEYAKYVLEKQEKLREKGVGTEFNYEAAKNQVASLETKMNSLSTQKGKANIKAPFSGVIDQVFARNGQMAGQQSPIVRLVNNSKVDIVASISEKHLSKVKVGTPIRVTFPNYEGHSVELTITNVGNYIEPTNRTFRIVASVDKNELLLPNMLAEIHITDVSVDNGMVIPSECIQQDQDNNAFVYILDGKTVKRVKVIVISSFEGNTLIETNAALKDKQVVTKGAKGVVEGPEVRVK